MKNHFFNVKSIIAHLQSYEAANVDTWFRIQRWVESDDVPAILEDAKSRAFDVDFPEQLEAIAQSIREARA